MLTISTLHEELDKGLDPDDVRDWCSIWEQEQADKEAQADKARDAEDE